MVQAIPTGYHSVTPYLIVKNAAAALEFYKKAFGAVELMRFPGPGGAPPTPPLKEIEVVRIGGGWRYVAVAAVTAAASAGATWLVVH